ncbi:MAG: chromosome partitioning protein ParA, partial [Acidobacteria bacterium]|nr:chromosome partitioning protein ParA [Acidobacteriota bacterium]
MSRASAIYGGWVRHRRFAPHPHAFSYRVFLMYLDLDELPELFRGRWFWSAERPAPARFRRADHLGDPAVPLKQAVAEKVREATGHAPAGPIRLLTHLAYFGYCFNPVSLYYCFDAAGERVETIV